MEIISDPVQLARKLVSIASETGNEGEVAEYIFDYLTALGLPAEKQEIEPGRFNVFVVGEGEVLFNDHIDTVPIGDARDWSTNPYGEIKDGRLYGRGSCDTKGNGACLLAALAKNPSRRVNCSFTIGEEDTFAGVKGLMKMRAGKFKHIKNCVNFEPTELRVVSAHKGRLHLVVRARGKVAHASVPEQGDNAILKLNAAISNLAKYAETFSASSHELLGHPTLNIGVIRGGAAANVVPDYAEFELDVRILPSQNVEQVVEEITRAVEAGTGAGNLRCAAVLPAEVKVKCAHNPVDLPVDSDFMKIFRGVLDDEGVDSRPVGARFTTEFSELFEHGIHGLVFGAGSVNQAHKVDEYVEVEELEKLYRVLCRLVEVV